MGIGEAEPSPDYRAWQRLVGKSLSEEVGGRIGLAIKLWVRQVCNRHIGDVDRGLAQHNSLAMTSTSR